MIGAIIAGTCLGILIFAATAAAVIAADHIARGR